VNALKSTSVDTAPRILIADFVRYNLGQKNQEIIDYPKQFTLKKYMSSEIDAVNQRKININKKATNTKENISEANTMYDLFGVIVHSGSSRSFGHYYSYCRGFESENQWYKCNDESVSKLNGIDGALGKQAYILFY